MISSRNKGTLADSYIAKGATKLSHANTIEFIRLFTVKPIFTLRTSQANIWVYQTVHSQAISLLGLLGYLAKPAFTVGFNRLSNQRLLTRSGATDIAKPIDGFNRLPTKPSFQLGLSGF